MRLSEFMDGPVLGTGDVELGRVIDVRIERSMGTPGTAPTLRVSAYVVDRHRAGGRLGYDRRPDHGPVLLRLALRWWHRSARLVAVEDAEFDPSRRALVLSVDAGAFARLETPDRS